jgi:hypothetical protein
MGCTAFNALVRLSVSAAKGLSFSAIASLSLSLILFVSTVFTIVVKLVAEKIYQHEFTQQHEPRSMESAKQRLADSYAKIAVLEAQIRESASGSPDTNARGISLVGKGLSVSVDLETVYNPAAAAAESGNTSELELAAFRDSIPKN